MFEFLLSFGLTKLRTVLHNLVFGCLLVFAIILLELQGQEANLLSIGAVDFGIVTNAAGHLQNPARCARIRPLHPARPTGCGQGMEVQIDCSPCSCSSASAR